MSRIYWSVQLTPAGDERNLVKIRIHLGSDGYSYSTGNATIRIGSQQHDLHEYLDRERMRLLQADGSILIGDYRYYTHATLNVRLPATLLSSWGLGNNEYPQRIYDAQNGFRFRARIYI